MILLPATFLRTTAGVLTARTSRPPLDSVAQALDACATATAEVRRQRLTHDLSGEAAGRIFGLGFGLEQLGHDLEDLADRVSELAQRPAVHRRRPGHDG